MNITDIYKLNLPKLKHFWGFFSLVVCELHFPDRVLTSSQIESTAADRRPRPLPRKRLQTFKSKGPRESRLFLPMGNDGESSGTRISAEDFERE